jgi:hypothetical protein
LNETDTLVAIEVLMFRHLLSTTLAATVLLSAGCTPPPGKEDPSLLIGRVWLDSKPERPTEYVHGMFLLSRPALGLFQRASNYDFHFERFDYERDGQSLALTFPQSGKKASLMYTVSACSALPPFDLCLDLSENPWGGPKRYYAKRHQDDEDEAASRALRAHLEQR